MTPQEFKAWFDGFTESVDKVPTQKQWARIKERVAEIDGKPVTERIYIDRYLPTYINYPPIWTTCGVGTANPSAYIPPMNTISSSAFDSLGAMSALGRAEALHQ